MHLASVRSYRLVRRGEPGLSCDRDGVALGPMPLVKASLDGTYEMRTPDELGVILDLAYGPPPRDVVERCHKALKRITACLDAGDLAKAGLEAVMIGLPELSSEAVRKLRQTGDLGKGGDAWRNEPRVPAGQPDGGQWNDR